MLSKKERAKIKRLREKNRILRIAVAAAAKRIRELDHELFEFKRDAGYFDYAKGM